MECAPARCVIKEAKDHENQQPVDRYYNVSVKTAGIFCPFPADDAVWKQGSFLEAVRSDKRAASRADPSLYREGEKADS